MDAKDVYSNCVGRLMLESWVLETVSPEQIFPDEHGAAAFLPQLQLLRATTHHR